MNAEQTLAKKQRMRDEEEKQRMRDEEKRRFGPYSATNRHERRKAAKLMRSKERRP